MITYQLATKEDIPALSGIIALSFQDYPLYVKFTKFGFEDQTSYLNFLSQLMAVQMRIDLKKGAGIVILDDDQPVGAAFFSPSLVENNIWDYFRTGGLRLFRYFKGGLLNGLLEQTDIAEGICRNKADEQTWYLSMLAISRGYQGQHLGHRVLIDQVFPYLKTRQIERLTLITNTEKNCRFYEANGFECFDQTKLALKDQIVQSWCFSRRL